MNFFTIFLMMLDKIKEALKTTKNVPRPIYKANPATAMIKLTSTFKNYKFKSHEVSENTPINDLNLMYNTNISLKNRTPFRFKFTQNETLFEIAEYLSKKLDVNYKNTFIRIKSIIFSNAENVTNNLQDLYNNEKYEFKEWNFKILDLKIEPNMCICFFDGISNFYNIKIDYLCNTNFQKSMSLVEINKKVVICKACEKNVSTILCIDDPILPHYAKNVCQDCFDELFKDASGELLYPDIKFINI